MSARRWMAATVLLLAAWPGAVSAGGGGATCDGYGGAAEIRMRDSCMQPTAAFVSEARTVTVRNDGMVPHTYTAVDGSFDTGTLQPGETADIEAQPGLHRVRCLLHSGEAGQGMTGLLVVGEPFAAAELASAQTAGRSGLVLPLVIALLGAGALALRPLRRRFRGRRVA